MGAQVTWEEAVQSLIDDKTQKELVRNCYFDLPLSGAAERYAASNEWREVRKLIGKPKGLAVDIGAGNGIVSYALASDGWPVVAVEPDPSDLVGAGAIRGLAKEAKLTIDVRPGVGEALPLEDGEADLVIVRQVLHHADDLPKFLIEIARILKPGGRLIALRDHVISDPLQLPKFLERHDLHVLYGGENAFEIKTYRAAIEGAGLAIERQIGSLDSPINYGPQTMEQLRSRLAGYAGPLKPVISLALAPRAVLSLLLRGLSKIDRRPGRLVSFVAQKT